MRGVAAEFTSANAGTTAGASATATAETTAADGNGDRVSVSGDLSYAFTAPVQPPLHPNYASFQELSRTGKLM